MSRIKGSTGPSAYAKRKKAAPSLLEAAKEALIAFQSGRGGWAAMVLLADAIESYESDHLQDCTADQCPTCASIDPHMTENGISGRITK